MDHIQLTVNPNGHDRNGPDNIYELGDHVLDGELAGDSTPWEWDSVVVEDGNTFGLSSSAAIHGSYGYRATFGGGNDAAYGIYNFTESTLLYVRFYFKFSNWSGSVGNYYTLNIQDSEGAASPVQIRFYWRGSNYFGLWAQTRQNSGYTTIVDKDDENIITSEAVHYLEMYWKQGNGDGAAEVWLDGTSQGSNSALTNTNYDADQIRIGIQGNWPGAGSIMDIDDVIIDTSYIGAYYVPTYTMLEAQHAAYGPAQFKRWDVCSVCDLLWPEDKLIEYEGKKYCIPLKHYRDIEYPDMLKMRK